MSVKMFGRPSDVRFQHGAAKLQNLITTAQGPAQKRPGLSFVREIKNSTARARLIPFAFSQDQTQMIEMGRSTVDGREIGYLRFHTQGSTLLFTQAPDFKGSSSVSAVDAGTELFLTPLATDFATGDPILFTIFPTSVGAATFASGSPGVVTVTNTLANGQQILFDALGGGGTLPPEVITQRIYYAVNPTGSVTQLSESRFGPPLDFSAASSGTIRVAWAPRGAAGFIDVRQTFYFIKVSATTFQIATSRENALAGTNVDIVALGTTGESLFVNFHYRVGDLVAFTDDRTYSLFRAPLGDLDSATIAISEVAVVPPTNTTYWKRMPGEWMVITFDEAADEVDWTGHPHSKGDTVIFSGGTPPGNITLGTVFFVVNPTTNAFQVALTPGGAPIDMTGAASGTTIALVGSIFEVPHFFTDQEILEVNYAQSNDVMTITHPNRPAIEIRRRGATNWQVGAIRFNQARPPADVAVAATSGAGFRVASVTIADPAVITTNRAHGLTALTQTFMVKDVADIPDGLFTTSAVGATTLTLATVGAHEDVETLIDTLGADPIVQPGADSIDFNQVYVVTSIGSNNEESGPSEEVPVVNYLLADGAFNTISWGAVGGAQLFRLYKKENGVGVFGLIAEILADQPLTFKDDNVLPDLSTTPPILDNSLRRLEVVTFDLTNSRVNLVNHGMENDQAVCLQDTAFMPPEITAYKTFFVVESTDDSFAIANVVGGTPIVITSPGNANERYEVSIGFFPNSVAYFEQRRVFAGSLVKRQRLIMTGSSTEADVSFSIPTVDDDRILVDVAAREGGAIRHVVPLTHLMLLSSSTEFRLTPINSDVITPSTISIRPQSFVGAARVQPAIVNNTGIFAANRGGHLREMGYSQNVSSYLTGDLTLRATHLFDGLTIEQIAYSRAPLPLIWCVSSNGKLLGLTYLPEEQIGAWHQHVTDGFVESCALIAEGDEDHLYVIVRRTIDGNVVRYVERMANLDVPAALADVFFVDAGITFDGAATTTITGLDHLEGATVIVLADGLVVRDLVVLNGAITLVTAASKVQVGLPYTAQLETLPATLGLPAGALDKTKNVSAVWVRVEESGAFSIGPTLTALTPTQVPAAGALLTGSVDVNIAGSWGPNGQVFIQQSDPLPLTIVAAVYEVVAGG